MAKLLRLLLILIATLMLFFFIFIIVFLVAIPSSTTAVTTPIEGAQGLHTIASAMPSQLPSYHAIIP